MSKETLTLGRLWASGTAAVMWVSACPSAVVRFKPSMSLAWVHGRSRPHMSVHLDRSRVQEAAMQGRVIPATFVESKGRYYVAQEGRFLLQIAAALHKGGDEVSLLD